MLEAQGEKAALRLECEEAREVAAQAAKQREELETTLAESQKTQTALNEQVAELQHKIAELQAQSQSRDEALYVSGCIWP